jgi:hypothetical protein
VIPRVRARTWLRECTKIGQPPPSVDLADPVDSCGEAFGDGRVLVAGVVSPRRGHGSLGSGGGWRWVRR